MLWNRIRSVPTACACLFGLITVSLPERSRADESPASGSPNATVKLSFDRKVRSILSNNCFRCHGPDAGERQAGLRLDLRQPALRRADSGKRAIVPGKPLESELLARIDATDPDLVMPPPGSNKTLSPAEREVLRQWIAEGADYQEHWSFIPPQRPHVPEVRQAAWPRDPIDYFVLSRLESEGLEPSPRADKVTLLRRWSLDLTGLPPTPAEVDRYLADTAADADERVVDRLLASPHFGERLALEWLDAARYADTHGFHRDAGRNMTRWRDWVINAFNRNLPFDQFTIEQLAGDLLPHATVDQKIASGFHRNHMINIETGSVPEEFQNVYVVDRVNTTATVWLGLTVGCSQCHDHKFDPLSQKEYYQLYAFFHNVPENGIDGANGNAVPLLSLPTAEQQATRTTVAASLQQVEKHLAAPELNAAQAAWEKAALRDSKIDWTVIAPRSLKSKGGATLTPLADSSVLVSGENPINDTYEVVLDTDLKEITAFRVDVLPDDSLAAHGPGRSTNGNIVLTDVRVECGEKEGALAPAAINWASADFSQQDFPIANSIDKQASTGWAVMPESGKPHEAVFGFARPVSFAGPTRLKISFDFQSQFLHHQFGRFRVSITSATDPHGVHRLPEPIARLLETSAEKLTPAGKAEVTRAFRTLYSTETKRLQQEHDGLRKSLTDLDRQVASTMVMQEMPRPRDTFLLVRGQYDRPGEKVEVGVPAVLPALKSTSPRNRLGLAQWLVDPGHPLTARVTVNRYWQMLFGNGIVKTSDDFGSQGEAPTHPALLDWLAVEFSNPVEKRDAWNVKALLKRIVLSSTYGQSAVVTPALFARDPENRLLARGSRVRLHVEFIRDQALAVSDLLDRRVGGTSVSPYQPDGIWEELTARLDSGNLTAQSYVQSHGTDLYRRTMYTFWKRTVPPPSLMTFDAPDRETCTVKRARTNTPLQALVLMNDPTYIETARKLAERMMIEPGQRHDDRIAFAFRLATARRPSPAEIAVLRKVYDVQVEVFRKDSAAALKLLSIGEFPRNSNLGVAELAAWTTVASAILNLDESVTKG